MTRRWPILFATTLLMLGLAQGCRSLHRDPPESAGPELVLLPGGRRHALEARWMEQPALGQKAFLGFMTEDIHRAASRLKSAGVRILHDVEHQDWGGTDLIVADADGNAVQVFALDTDHRFGSDRTRQ